jgi:hypothetical protein
MADAPEGLAEEVAALPLRPTWRGVTTDHSRIENTSIKMMQIFLPLSKIRVLFASC